MSPHWGRQRRSRQRPPCVKGAVILTQKWQNDWGIDNPSVKNQRFLPPPFAQGRLCAALAALSAHRADKFKQYDKHQFGIIFYRIQKYHQLIASFPKKMHKSLVYWFYFYWKHPVLRVNFRKRMLCFIWLFNYIS